MKLFTECTFYTIIVRSFRCQFLNISYYFKKYFSVVSLINCVWCWFCLMQWEISFKILEIMKISHLSCPSLIWYENTKYCFGPFWSKWFICIKEYCFIGIHILGKWDILNKSVLLIVIFFIFCTVPVVFQSQHPTSFVSTLACKILP